MMTLPSMLVLGFLLGMRHATDADHVVAVSTIVERDRTLRGAARIGSLWGAGHTLTVLLVGGAIILFGLVIPPRVGLALELVVGVMLVVLGGLSLAAGRRAHAHPHEPAAPRRTGALADFLDVRPVLVGVVHGLAGSAAIALFVLSTIHDPLAALAYLALFGGGTVAGMVLITVLIAVPLAAARNTFSRAGRYLGLAAGVASVAFGLFLVYRIGFVDGLFTASPRWTPG